MVYAVASTRLPCWLTRLHHFDGALEDRAQLAGVPDRPSAQRSSNPSIWPAMRNRCPVLDAGADRAALHAGRRPVGAAQSGLGSPAAFLDELDACFEHRNVGVDESDVVSGRAHFLLKYRYGPLH